MSATTVRPASVTPQSNVIAPQNWPANPIYPGRRPPVPPNCFSELAGLSQCYNDVQIMQQLLSKVICDLATNDKQFAQCLANGIGSVGGSTAPIQGVTNGEAAAPGVVGEFQYFSQVGTTSGAVNDTHNITMGILQPGDWDIEAFIYSNAVLNSVNFYLNPNPPGTSYPLQTFEVWPGASDIQGDLVMTSPRAQGLYSVPTLMPMTIIFNQGGTATAGGGFTMALTARRMR